MSNSLQLMSMLINREGERSLTSKYIGRLGYDPDIDQVSIDILYTNVEKLVNEQILAHYEAASELTSRKQDSDLNNIVLAIVFDDLMSMVSSIIGNSNKRQRFDFEA